VKRLEVGSWVRCALYGAMPVILQSAVITGVLCAVCTQQLL